MSEITREAVDKLVAGLEGAGHAEGYWHPEILTYTGGHCLVCGVASGWPCAPLLAASTLRALLNERDALKAKVQELSTPNLFGAPNGDCGYERSDLWCVGVEEMEMRLGDVRPCGWANRVLEPGWLAFVPLDDDSGEIEWFASQAEAQAAVAAAREAINAAQDSAR